MTQVINTNILAMAAQNNLNKSQALLGTAIQRLSSGWRINSAKDDAAGQAISNRFTSLINGLNQASRNANDGISVSQTAEGAINEINENLHAIRRLTVQVKSTATISNADKRSIQNEIDKRLDEINRIANQTEFNGLKILSKDQKLSIQVGANDGEVVDIELKQLDVKKLGIEDFSVLSEFKNSEISNENEKNIIKWVIPTIFSSVNDIEIHEIDHKIYVKDSEYYVKDKNQDIYYKAKIIEDNGSLKLEYNDNYEKLEDNSLIPPTDAITDQDEIKKIRISNQGIKHGTFMVTSIPNNMSLHKYISDNDGIISEEYVLKNIENGDAAYYKAEIDNLGKVKKGERLEVSDSGKTITTNPLSKLDAAIANIDELRGVIGATQNRLGSVINSLSATIVNLSQSRSNILDADFAIEFSNMNKANILQQAGLAVLAQANSVPQGILSLLR